tara:strand:+ start:120 stop:350 length:231 start_codon:yes stop_codon:yes gene_type:complete
MIMKDIKNMKTPMQEMLEFVHDEVQLFGSARQILINKVKEMIEKEKEQIIEAYEVSHISMMTAEQYYNETFNTKEK